MASIDLFRGLLLGNRQGKATGVYSICSANRAVILAGLAQAAADGSLVLVESTSNQVDQFGGYTGMKPADFAAYLRGLAAEAGFPADRLLLGGDHLGPNAWQNLPAAQAMAHSRELVKQYVAAGFQKIHLDCSMFLADDPGDRAKPLADELVSERAAELAAVAEAAWKALPAGSPAPVYVIGTEVPIPGGAKAHEDTVPATPAADARHTVEVAERAFRSAGLAAAWERVVALVVQPGVEFGDAQVFDYDRAAAAELSKALDDRPPLVFEAHSTDYQTPAGLRRLVEDHFCILKVGPALTFAYREALFALARIEQDVLYGRGDALSDLIERLDEAMLAQPKYWQKYYPGDEGERRLKRKFSYSDRSRYYWPDASLAAAVARLYANLRAQGVPETALSQYLGDQYRAYRDGRISLDPEAIVLDHIRDVMRVYARACGLAGN
jgi:D-tagatose-1,6-bisphosphate aldolase subunit GatZ/KbaZ